MGKKVYDREWQKVRAHYLFHHPRCAICGKTAIDVDHKNNIRDAPHRKYDESNLQSLCHKHHSLVTQAFDNGKVRGACDEDGMPVDPGHPWNQPDNRRAIEVANLPQQRVDPKVAARIKEQHIRSGQRRRR
jgi:septum formation inhibitor MinC